MPPVNPLLRRLGACASLAGLLAQAVLPAAHSCSVARQEAVYHASIHDAVPQASLCGAHGRAHSHHSDVDCPLCPLYSTARLAAVHGAGTAGAPARLTPLPSTALGLISPADVSGAPVRGPPAARSA